MQWTEQNPGVGDLNVIVDWQKRNESAAEIIDSVTTNLSRAATTSAETWNSVSADAYSDSVASRVSRLKQLAESARVVAGAARAYRDEVERIKDEAVPWLDQAQFSQRVLDDPGLTDEAGPGIRRPTEAQGDARRGQLEAIDLLHEATTHLSRFAERRHTADQQLMSLAMAQRSSYLDTDHQTFDEMTSQIDVGSDRAALLLFGMFAMGVAPRELGYTDSSAFGRAIASSGHVRHVRELIGEALRSRSLKLGDEIVERRELSSDVKTLAGDALNALTLGRYGNLSESFVGSYKLVGEVVEIDAGTATVTFAITNDTTRDSLNRFPGGGSMPWASLVESAGRHGYFQPTGQTIVWTEVIHQ